MSGEFGSYSSGYFYTQMEIAAEDCKSGSDQLTRLWGDFFEAFYPVAKAISWSEAGDTGAYRPILVNIEKQNALRNALANIEKYLSTFEDVIEAAIQEETKKPK